jgi:cytochrome c551/c552
MKPFRRAVLALGAALTLAGCGGGGDGATDAAATVASSPLDAGPRASDAPVARALAETGEALFKSKTCSTCHAFGTRITGPDLLGVTKRRTAAWMEQQILHPDVMTKEDPIARELLGKYAVQMPNLMLKPDEAKALIEYMKEKDQEPADAE